MILKTLRPLVMGASILVLGGAGAAFAQPASPPPSGMMGGVHDAGPGPGPGGMGGMRGQKMDPAAMAQRHADHLRAALQLTPAQEPALKAFMADMTPPPGMHDRMMGMRQEMAGLTTPQRLDRMRARMDEHRAMFERHAAAVKRFYAQLTPAQQKAFDAMPMGHMGHGDGMGGGHKGMRGPMGHGMQATPGKPG